MIKKLFIAASYLLGALIIVGGTVLLVAYGEGYRYNFKERKLIRTGLIIIDTEPSSATVYVNGKQVKKRTPYRKTSLTGTYAVDLKKDGYRDWNRVFNVTSDEVSLAQYVLMVPNQPTTETITSTKGKIGSFVASNDRRHAAYTVLEGNDAGVWLTNTTNETPQKLYGFVPGETVAELSLADDGQHALALVNNGTALRYLVLAPNNDPVDVTSTFGPGYEGGVRMNPSNWKELYSLKIDGLRKLDLGSKIASSVLAERVVTYEFTGDRITYVQAPVDVTSPAAKLWALDRSNRKQELDNALPLSQAYALDYATYLGTPQLAVVMPTVATTRIYAEPFNQDRRVTTPVNTGDANRAMFNDDGRYFVAAGSGVVLFDLERRSLLPLATPVSTQGLTWFDNFHLLSIKDGQSVLSEYDGNYSNTLGQTAFPATAGGGGAHDVVSVTQPSVDGTQKIIRTKIRQ